jgi:hypothetical protein
MNTSNLTNSQLKAVEKVVAEFTKMNEPKPVSSGLINVSLIKENEAFKASEQIRIKAANELYKQIVFETVKSDCNKIKDDLAQLGLKAFARQKYLRCDEFELVICEKNYNENSNSDFGRFIIQYIIVNEANNRIYETNEYKLFTIMFQNCTFTNGFEECMKSDRCQKEIAKLYKTYSMNKD